MGTFAEGAPGAGENTALNWQRGSTRKAIFDATRLIAARQGTLDFSLHDVAREAGCSATTLFAYFQTKTHLLNAMVAEDLATLARKMRGSYQFAIRQQSKDRFLGEKKQIFERAAFDPDRELPAPKIVSLSPIVETKSEEIPKLQASRIDAWLERRLRVFEKSLIDIEARVTAAHNESGKALSTVLEVTQNISLRLVTSEARVEALSDDVAERLLAAEKRLRENHSELRGSLLSASMRIDVLEAAAKFVLPETVSTPQAILEPWPVAEPPPVKKPVSDSSESYLSAARRAALAASTLNQIDSPAPKKSPRSYWFNKATAALALAIMVLFLLGALIAFALGEHAGRTVPIHVVVPAAIVHPGKVAKAAPVDRLSTLAHLGDSRAQLLVGLRYLKGQGVAIDQPQGAKWIEKAAASAPLAQYWMGQVYQHGEGVSPDAAEALRWYTAAATHGNREAMYDLGVAYAEGLGTQKDFAQSADWFTKAATSGLTNAQFNLAVLYERGEGVSQSLTSAYKWYAIAAASGDIESKARIDAIATQLTASELATAKDAATSFTPQPTDRSANVLPNPSDIIPQRAS